MSHNSFIVITLKFETPIQSLINLLDATLIHNIGLLCINFLIERCGKPELAREKAVTDDVGYKVIPMD